MDLAKLNSSIQSSQYSIAATTIRKSITTVIEISILLTMSVEFISVKAFCLHSYNKWFVKYFSPTQGV
jgi:hypothetical protein